MTCKRHLANWCEYPNLVVSPRIFRFHQKRRFSQVCPPRETLHFFWGQTITINDNGSWSFDPDHAAYDSLADGDVQKINVTYQVADADGLTDEESFVITLTGTNDAPVATFAAAQTAITQSIKN